MLARLDARTNCWNRVEEQTPIIRGDFLARNLEKRSRWSDIVVIIACVMDVRFVIRLEVDRSDFSMKFFQVNVYFVPTIIDLFMKDE